MDGGACKGRESGEKRGQREWEAQTSLVANARAGVREYLQRELCGFPAGAVVRIHLPMQDTQEMWVPSLGWEDLLEKGMATQCRILAWKILWTEEPDGLQTMGSQESDTTEPTHTHTHARMNTQKTMLPSILRKALNCKRKNKVSE